MPSRRGFQGQLRRVDEAPPRVGVSSCLLGEAVRWDGGHKRDPLLAGALAPWLEWVRVCPEVELGMGTPREPVELVREGGALRMRGARSRRDWTEAMESFAARRVRALARADLSGYVLKQDSPSCGPSRVKVRGRRVRREGSGLFAAALHTALPALPIEEEGRLHDPLLREHWLERVFACRRLRWLRAGRFSRARLVAFHAAHELQLLAHGAEALRRLGRIVAGAQRMESGALRRRYETAFLAALAEPATRPGHAHVLRHCLGKLRGRLEPAAEAAIATQVTGYRRGRVPLVVPVTAIRHAAARLEIASLTGQLYLDPSPRERMLRYET